MESKRNHSQAFRTYIASLNRNLQTGDATERTHRSALITLIKSLVPGVTCVDEPARRADAAPDILVKKGDLIVGYIETKDIGSAAYDNWHEGEQGKKYLQRFPEGLVLTDYVRFKWFVDGSVQEEQTLGYIRRGKLTSAVEAEEFVGRLIESFLSRQPTGVSTAEELAKRMASKAHGIRELILDELSKENENGHLHSQMEAFRKTLLKDLTEQDFADMYAQTLAYGLFAARVQHDKETPGVPFTLREAASFIPRSNPFLRKLFRIGSDELSEMKKLVWQIDDLVQLLGKCDIGEVARYFGTRRGRYDPVTDLYETFLKHYDPRIREMRGVYYTPDPVAWYIVRSIDTLLKREFGKKLGLADPSVFILDPAVGTGTFLSCAIEVIHSCVKNTYGVGAWRSYVREKLINRIFGFELLMAPYTICHLRLALQLQWSGYELSEGDRLHIYLTNALEPGVPQVKETTLVFADEIVKEAKASADVKTETPIWVVMGNPPYSGHSANKGKWIDGLLKGKVSDGTVPCSYYEVEGKPLEERNPKWLQDDYVKFIRFAQWRIEKTGYGIVGMITNHSWLDNPTFRGMREKLMKAFNKIYVLDLHGNVKKKERAPDGSKDENVFDIQQGVAITLMVKKPEQNPRAVYHFELWGNAGKDKYPSMPLGTKYEYLYTKEVSQTKWREVKPEGPLYLFTPRDTTTETEYLKGWRVPQIFPVNSVGFVTSRDAFVIDFDLEKLKKRVDEFFDLRVKDHLVRERYSLKDTRDWKLESARQRRRHKFSWEELFTCCLYRPFDYRWTHYGNSLIEMPRPEVMRHMLAGENVALITARQQPRLGELPVFCSQDIVEGHALSGAVSITYVFPLYLYYENDTLLDEPKPNLNPDFVREFEDKLQANRGSLPARDIFNYIYAILHSPTYRRRYEEFLKYDFPRIPLTSNKNVFKSLAELGGELVKLHLLKHESLTSPIAKFQGIGDGVVRKVSYHDVSGRVKINETQYFEVVKPEHWNFYIGGYRVLEKWLKDREKIKRRLTHDEIETYEKIVTAIDETIRIMRRIDESIPSWPIE